MCSKTITLEEFTSFYLPVSFSNGTASPPLSLPAGSKSPVISQSPTPFLAKDPQASTIPKAPGPISQSYLPQAVTPRGLQQTASARNVINETEREVKSLRQTDQLSGVLPAENPEQTRQGHAAPRMMQASPSQSSTMSNMRGTKYGAPPEMHNSYSRQQNIQQMVSPYLPFSPSHLT